MKNSKTLILVECAIMLGFAAVLCNAVLWRQPMGGSVTPMSMLPIVLISIKYGVKIGLPVAFLFSLIEFASSRFVMFGWGMTPAAVIGSVMLDYILAFTLIGFAGMLRTKGFVGWISGISLVMALRFICHVISGIIIFGQWAPEGQNVAVYSIIYNGAYMLPELGFTVVGAAVLLKTHLRIFFVPV